MSYGQGQCLPPVSPPPVYQVHMSYAGEHKDDNINDCVEGTIEVSSVCRPSSSLIPVKFDLVLFPEGSKIF